MYRYIIYIYVIYIYIYILVVISDLRHTECSNLTVSQKPDECNLYGIMKTMCPPGYHHNGFVATHALGHMMYG